MEKHVLQNSLKDGCDYFNELFHMLYIYIEREETLYWHRATNETNNGFPKSTFVTSAV